MAETGASDVPQGLSPLGQWAKQSLRPPVHLWQRAHRRRPRAEQVFQIGFRCGLEIGVAGKRFRLELPASESLRRIQLQFPHRRRRNPVETLLGVLGPVKCLLA